MQANPARTVRLRPRTRAGAPHRVAVFTSIDGTLLDSRTLEAGPAASAIRRLHATGVPVIPVSVMTLDEIAPVANELGLQHSMIFEAGGAIARWSGTAWEVEACGPPTETLLGVVLDIEQRSGANLLLYSALPENLLAPKRRCFSEPFLLETGDLEAVQRAASAIGFSVRRGRRFLHLCRACDQGEAFTRLRDELRCDVAIAIGSSAVDAEFLSRANLPVIIPRADGTADAELLAAVPHARIAPASGPVGWAAAVEETMQSLALPKRRAER